jgi:hypothetical protein
MVKQQMADIHFRFEGLRSGPHDLFGLPDSQIRLYMAGLDEPVYTFTVPAAGEWIMWGSLQDEVFNRFLNDTAFNEITDDPELIAMFKAIRGERRYNVDHSYRTALFTPTGEENARKDATEFVLTDARRRQDVGEVTPPQEATEARRTEHAELITEVVTAALTTRRVPRELMVRVRDLWLLEEPDPIHCRFRNECYLLRAVTPVDDFPRNGCLGFNLALQLITIGHVPLA